MIDRKQIIGFYVYSILRNKNENVESSKNQKQKQKNMVISGVADVNENEQCGLIASI